MSFSWHYMYNIELCKQKFRRLLTDILLICVSEKFVENGNSCNQYFLGVFCFCLVFWQQPQVLPVLQLHVVHSRTTKKKTFKTDRDFLLVRIQAKSFQNDCADLSYRSGTQHVGRSRCHSLCGCHRGLRRLSQPGPIGKP